MIAYPIWAWAGFILFVAALLAVDLGVLNRRAREVKSREAATWCAVWFSLAMCFNALVLAGHGAQAGAQWFASYLVELSLSVDNVFVFIVIFAFFKVPPENQHRVLFWGIVGAAVMRAVFILAGLRLIGSFGWWVLMVFGAFLVFTGVRLALPSGGKEQVNPEKNIIVRAFKRFFPVSDNYDGARFFTVVEREGKMRRVATPLFVTLLVIETTDVVFAVDSIPAVLGITKEPFIAFTSNIFAILGLRSLYFALRGLMGKFRFLNIGLAVILVFIGLKMLAEKWHDVSIAVSLGVIGGVLALAVVASLVFPGSKQRAS
jgi:tellurite resistance protein TerC